MTLQSEQSAADTCGGGGDTVIVRVIRAVFSSTVHTLRTTVGDSAIAEIDVGGGSQSEDSATHLVAALSPPTGPVRSLLVCCDTRLASRISDRLVLPSSASDSSRTACGFHILCSVLQQNLAAETDWYVPTPDIVYFGPGHLHEHGVGDRFFRIVARASDAAVEVFVSASVSETLVSAPSPVEPVGLVADDRHRRAISGSALEEVFAPLGHTDIDVQIEFPVSRSHTEVHYAKIVSRTIIQGHSVLGIFIPALRQSEEFLSKGTEVLTYLPHDGRLYQFRTTVVGIAHLQLEASARLKLLAVNTPTSLVPGQRRRAFRVNPRSPVRVTIERWIVQDDHETFETATPVDATLYDISLNGVRVFSLGGELCRTYAVGNLVLCRLGLSEGAPTTVPGIVRRTARVPTPDGDRYDLAVEFLNNPSWTFFAEALTHVADFVRSEQLRARGVT